MKPIDVHLTVMGDGGSGNKTACTIRFCSDHFVEGKIED